MSVRCCAHLVAGCEDDGVGPAEADDPAEAGELVAEAGGWPSAGTGGRELAEAAMLAEADLVVAAATKGVLMVRALVSTNSPADAPQRRHY